IAGQPQAPRDQHRSRKRCRQRFGTTGADGEERRSGEGVTMAQAQFGMIGLGVMGENLALNIEEHGFPVAVWNLEGEWVDRFVGSGVSGGEEGARFGPSLMPGGSAESWKAIQPVFEAIAAKSDSGPCVTHVGPDGAGHFVKMVHNGIEYGDMQLIAEAYEMLRRGTGADASRLAEILDDWNRGPLESFLVEITAKIFRAKDPERGAPLVDKV